MQREIASEWLVAPVGSPRKEPVEMSAVQPVPPASGLNVTQDVHDASVAMLDRIDPPDGFLLKHRLPSRGPMDVTKRSMRICPFFPWCRMSHSEKGNDHA